jgi:glycosyltransferase involved in cell wall biosynthesis
MAMERGAPGVRASKEPRIAIVHEWLETYAGSERVLEQLICCFPQADVFAVVDFLPPHQRGFLNGHKVTTTFIQRLPLARRWFRHYLGLMGFAVEQLDLSSYDLVLSSSHAVAKGVITGPDQPHISYIHSPMRYAWDLQHQYLEHASVHTGLKTLYARWLLARLRQWDARTGQGVDVFIANSRYIARRIRKVYRREAEVIHPPVDIDRFALCEQKGDYYLVVSRQVPYKRVDLIAEAFALMPDRKLVIVGDGPGNGRVRDAAADAANITMLGAVSSAEVCRLMQSARAFVVAAEEDFGISMVEAQACGTPLICYGKGGVLDIVTAGPGAPTGVLFGEQSADSIIAAVTRFDEIRSCFTPKACRQNATRFSTQVFRERITRLVTAVAMDNAAACRPEMSFNPLPEAATLSRPLQREMERQAGHRLAESAAPDHV